eukprot:COSAG02_NODE_36746_length_451_cov_0.732955_1_plen_59_part_10
MICYVTGPSVDVKPTLDVRPSDVQLVLNEPTLHPLVISGGIHVEGLSPSGVTVSHVGHC